MATWAPPSDANLAAGKPATQANIRAVRDLSAALAERASGSPWVNEFGSEERFPRWLTNGPDPDLVDEWVVPDGVFSAMAVIVGGGGRGGPAGNLGGNDAGSGGGAGATTIVRFDTVPGQVWSIIIGAGGSSSAHPTINQDLDNYEVGDGGRTTFGTHTAAGGKTGKSHTLEGFDHYGVGGNQTSDGGSPTIKGGDGTPGTISLFGFTGFSVWLSGAGGASYLGPGAQSVGDGDGNFPGQRNAVVDSLARNIAIPGAGGSGGSRSGGPVVDGGEGAYGAVVVRY